MNWAKCLRCHAEWLGSSLETEVDCPECGKPLVKKLSNIAAFGYCESTDCEDAEIKSDLILFGGKLLCCGCLELAQDIEDANAANRADEFDL
jgi:hypothetical protein